MVKYGEGVISDKLGATEDLDLSASLWGGEVENQAVRVAELPVLLSQLMM